MNTFNKEERLCSRKSLDLLFKNGSSFLLYPYRVSYLFVPGKQQFPVQVVVNVAKKRYKRAVDRNLIKRRIREAYRLQKEILPQNPRLIFALVYAHKEILPFVELKSRLASVLKRIPKTVENPA